jgi:hypothetical protein
MPFLLTCRFLPLAEDAMSGSLGRVKLLPWASVQVLLAALKRRLLAERADAHRIPPEQLASKDCWLMGRPGDVTASIHQETICTFPLASQVGMEGDQTS